METAGRGLDGGRVRRRGLDVALAVGLGLAAALTVTLTLRHVGLTYDEPPNIDFQTRMRHWIGLLLSPGQSADPAAFETYWSYETARHHHPPMAGYLANLAWVAFNRWMGEPWSYRMAGAILFGLLVGLLFWEAGRTWGRLAGVAAAAALVLMPRVFGHAHVGVSDTPSMVFWFLSCMTFRRLCTGRRVAPVAYQPARDIAPQAGRLGGGDSGEATPEGLEESASSDAEPAPCASEDAHSSLGRRRAGAAVRARGACLAAGLFGVVLGLSLLVRFTNWLVLIPLAACGLRFRWRVPWRWLWVAAAVALAVAIGLNPRWWGNPAAGIYQFLESSLTRDRLSPIPTHFLGRTYEFGLPWYNAPVLTAATTPLAILALFVVGLGAVCRNRLRTDVGTLAVASLAVLWGVRALPGTPGHDGIRLFLPAFPFVAALAGAGLAALARLSGRPRLVGGALLAMTVASAGYQLARSHPYLLSYYGEAVGGPAGAQRLGFETTYWWDAATDDFLDLLNADLPPGAHVYAVPGWPTLDYWQRRGRLRRDIVFVTEERDFPRIEFLILLSRQGMFDPRFASPRLPRPSGYTVEAVWHWYRTWDRQWRAVAPRYGVPLIVVVRHEKPPLL